MTSMTTILGAGGAIGNEIADILAARKKPFRLAGHNPRPVAGGHCLQQSWDGGEADFFDNVYMYGKVAGAMTEDTPFALSKKNPMRPGPHP